jgi:hypothetical protein
MIHPRNFSLHLFFVSCGSSVVSSVVAESGDSKDVFSPRAYFDVFVSVAVIPDVINPAFQYYFCT